jgi:hypothetical protein
VETAGGWRRPRRWRPAGRARRRGRPGRGLGRRAAQIKAAAASTTQANVLQSTGFLTRTPLWYYPLAEAKHHGGQRLGPVGSIILAEVLIGLVRRSDDSILRTPGWTPTLPAATPGRFELADLLRFAKVLP